jgi:hypothetical protein
VAELHASHRWDESGEVAICRDCRVEGYDDEAAAFAPCLVGPPPAPPAPPKKTKERAECSATMRSRRVAGHTHRCGGGIHPQGMHHCQDCDRWFGVS